MADSRDTAHRKLILDGVSLTDLRHIFGMHSDEIATRLKQSGVTGCGRRNNAVIYNLREAAKAILTISLGDTEEDAELLGNILRMHHNKLPKMLSKEYWAAQLAKQRYEQLSGDLWPTTRIVEFCGDAFKQIRLCLQLMADTVEREQTLNEPQRRVIQNLVDSTLNDMREKLVNGFNARGDEQGDEQGSPEEDDEGEGL